MTRPGDPTRPDDTSPPTRPLSRVTLSGPDLGTVDLEFEGDTPPDGGTAARTDVTRAEGARADLSSTDAGSTDVPDFDPRLYEAALPRPD
ncbi:hypothetical protein IHN59_18765, partial [Deinococcus sp. 23YEL01]|nr:hypothetical protein [Deinococcus sp. 23YEL01]